MSRIFGFGDRKPDKTQKGALTESKSASQAKESEPLIPKIQETSLHFSGVFILGQIERYWASSSAKNEILKQIQDILIRKKGATPKEAKQFTSTFISPFLKNLSLKELDAFKRFTSQEQVIDHYVDLINRLPENERKKAMAAQVSLSARLPYQIAKELLQFGILESLIEPKNADHFIRFLNHPQGADYINRCLKQYANSPALMKEAVNHILKAMDKNPEGVFLALSLYPSVSRMMGTRFSETNRLAYIDEWMHALVEMEYSEANNHLHSFEAFLKQAEFIQAERPKTFHPGEQPAFEELGASLTMSLTRFPILQGSATEIKDLTLPYNTQALDESIRPLFLPRDENTRSVPTLRPRTFSYPFTLSRVFRPSGTIVLEEGSDQIDFHAETDFYITNAKTGETRCLRMPLPFQGPMSKTEARKLLQLLSNCIADPRPEQFDKLYLEQGLDPAKKDLYKTIFLDWTNRAEQRLAQLIFDFNETDTQPKFFYAKRLPAVAAAIQNPDSIEDAVAAAKTKNLYRFEGHLSLLPPELQSDTHREIGELSDNVLQMASEKFVQGSAEPIVLKVPVSTEKGIEISEGKVHFEFPTPRPVGSSEREWIEVNTIIQCEGREWIRPTLYEVEKNETRSQALERLVANGVFHCDLLLAKAEFMEAHAPASLTNDFVINEAGQDIPQELLRVILRDYLQPLSLDRKEELNEFLQNGGFFYLKQLIEAQTDPTETPSNIQKQMRSALDLYKKNPVAFQQILSTYRRVSTMLEGRLSAVARFENLQTFIKMLALDSEELDSHQLSDFLARWEELLVKAEDIQNKRPVVYTLASEEGKALEEAASASLALIGSILDSSITRPIQNLVSEIMNMSIVTHLRSVQQNLNALHSPPTPQTTQMLEEEFDYSFGLCREFHLQDGLIDIYITNPKTMETRNMHMPLPIQKDLEPEMSKRLLRVLEATAMGLDRFDQAYAAEKLPPQDQERYKRVFTDWIKDVQTEMGHLIFDFNATEERPPFTFALENEAMQTALKAPEDANLAANAAKSKNIFLFNGKLSLLPPQLVEKHPRIATLSPQELDGAQLQFLGIRVTPLKFAMPTKEGSLEDADVSFETEMITIKGRPLLRVLTTIQRGDEKMARTTFYANDENAPNFKDKISGSPLFHRDLLLAKAEFMSLYA